MGLTCECADRYRHAVVCVKVFAVCIHVPRLQLIEAGRAAFKVRRDLLRTPRPEGFCAALVRNGELNAGHRRSVAPQLQPSVFPRLRVAADGVVERVLHPARLIEIADEKAVLAAALDTLCVCPRQCERRELRPVAGGGRERPLVLIEGQVRDCVGCAVVAEDFVARLGNEGHRVRLRDGDGAVLRFIVRIAGARLDLHRARIVVPGDVEADLLADVTELEVVVAADVVAGQRDLLSVERDALLHFRKRRCDHARGVGRRAAEQQRPADEARRKAGKVSFHSRLPPFSFLQPA